MKLALLAVPLLSSLILAGSEASAQACEGIVVSSPRPFLGNHGELVRLSDDSLWEVRYSYLYLYEYYPGGLICRRQGILQIGDESIAVVPLAGPGDYVETRLYGEFGGYESGKLYRLQNGQVWEQVDAAYSYSYSYAPEVILLQRDGVTQMFVGGADRGVTVRLLAGIDPSQSRSDSSSDPTGRPGDYIETRLYGEFGGYESGKLYRLQNGQVWKQVDAAYSYSYSYAPEVILVQRDGVTRMFVGGADQGVTVRLVAGDVDVPTTLGSSFTLEELEGAVILADDGTELGRITKDCWRVDAICNSTGRHGSSTRRASIFNTSGRFGGSYSAMSAFNELASRPPLIIKNGRTLGYVTTNSGKSPRVDPRWLRAVLR